MGSSKVLTEVIGTRTERGFEIVCPEVGTPTGKLHQLGNSKSLLGLVQERADDDANVDMVHRSRVSMYGDHPNSSPAKAHFYQCMKTGYNGHFAVCLRPEVLWHLVAHEVGIFVSQNKDACAGFFTTSPDEKKKLEIKMYEGEAWETMLLRFRQAFEPHIAPDVLRTFLPKFTTTDTEAETATLLTFMDSVSPWYEYGGMMIACGFPKILLAGNMTDWKLLQSSVSALTHMFEGMGPYFTGLLGVLHGIITTIESGKVDPQFWGSMYRYEHPASGSPQIEGWLSAFIAYTRGEPPQMRTSFSWGSEHDGLNPRELCDGVNYANMKVSFENGAPDQSLLLVSGVLGSEYDNEGYLTPRLGFAVAKL